MANKSFSAEEFTGAKLEESLFFESIFLFEKNLSSERNSLFKLNSFSLLASSDEE